MGVRHPRARLPTSNEEEMHNAGPICPDRHAPLLFVREGGWRAGWCFRRGSRTSNIECADHRGNEPKKHGRKVRKGLIFSIIGVLLASWLLLSPMIYSVLLRFIMI